MANCPKCGAPLQDGQASCPSCGSTMNNQPAPSGNSAPWQLTQTELPMKWHKFLVYFALWLSALMSLSYGIQYITGSVVSYLEAGVKADSLYRIFPGLGPLDKVYGVLQLCVGALTIVVALRLMKFKKGAWPYPAALYAVNLAVSLIYVIGLFAVVKGGDTGALIGQTATMLVLSAAMAWASYTYYKKRSHFFVN